MKKIIFSAAIIFAVGFSVKSDNKATATVNQVDGYYIFVDCTPVSEFKYLGSVKFAGTLYAGSGQYTNVRDKLIKRVKKDWPTANGIMFHFSSGSADKADAILIK